MKVFVSWSGERGGKMAEGLVAALKTTLQAVKPWFSKQAIRGGDQWFQEIQGGLRDSRFAIVCLTADSMASNWVHFEAGAIAFQMDKSKVAPLLLDVGKADLVPPLGMFQGARFDDRDDVAKLFSSLNDALPDGGRLDAEVLKEMSGLFFDKLQTTLKPLETQEADKGAKKVKRSEREMLEEVLGHVRLLANRVESGAHRSVELPSIAQAFRLEAETAALNDRQEQAWQQVVFAQTHLDNLGLPTGDLGGDTTRHYEAERHVAAATQKLKDLDVEYNRLMILRGRRPRSNPTVEQIASLWKDLSTDTKP